MQSMLLTSKDQQKKTDYIEHFAKDKDISQFDLAKFEPTGSSFGIADVRNVQKTAYIAPGHGKEKMIVIEKAELLTTEAQNALLKLLEEPPQNTYIILSADSENNFLPTILSRCKHIAIEQSREEVSGKEKEQLIQQLRIIQQGNIDEKLTLAEYVAGNKDELNQWFIHSILLSREAMLQDPKNMQILQTVSLLQDAYKDFQTTNVSPRMILEHYFLSF